MAISAVTLPDAINFTKEPIIIELQTNINQANFSTKLLLGITIYMPDGLISVTQEELAAPDGKIYFDLAGLLDEAIKHESTAPGIDDDLIVELAKGPFKFSAEYIEYKDGVSESTGLINDFNNSGEHYIILNGGYSHEALLTGEKFWIDQFPADAPVYPFLNWQENKRLVDKDQPCVMHYYNKDISGQLRIYLRVYNNVTLVYTNNDYFDLNCVPNKIYSVYAGYKKLDIDAALASMAYTGAITHWTITLTDLPGTVVSDTLTFYLNSKYYPSITRLMFENSLGGWEDTMFTGEYEIKAEHDRYSAVLNNPGVSGPLNGIKRTFGVNESYGRKFNTAPLSRNQIHCLRQLLLSERIYSIENSLFLPIEFTEKAKELIKTAKLNADLTLEFKYTFKNKVYTPLNKLGL